MRRRFLPAALVALAVLLAAAAVHATERLPALGVALEQTSVSGLSSGAFMAVQFHVAHSATVRGAGVIAGGPYFCAEGSVLRALYHCMRPGRFTPLPPTAALVSFTHAFAASGQIDPPGHLAGARVWLFSGARDEVVHPDVVEAARRYYLAFTAPANVVLVKGVPAGHGMVTEDAGNACAVTAPPFVNDCDFDAAGALLAHIHGPLAPPAAVPAGRLLRFDQREFADGDAFSASLADAGFAYVPDVCAQGGCRVHVVFHGCRQSAEAVGEVFVREAGYNRWADTNRLVVLYPQTIARRGFGFLAPGAFVMNPNGCWDWWGYTGPLYATKAGPQIRAVRAMLERLSSDPRRPEAGGYNRPTR